MRVLNEGDDPHLCFTLGTLEWVDLIYALYARGPTTLTELDSTDFGELAEVTTIVRFPFSRSVFVSCDEPLRQLVTLLQNAPLAAPPDPLSSQTASRAPSPPSLPPRAPLIGPRSGRLYGYQLSPYTVWVTDARKRALAPNGTRARYHPAPFSFPLSVTPV